MAKVLEMPSEGIISGFKGVIDYYYWMGIACVRRWPGSPGKRRTPAVMAQWQPFRVAAREWVELDPEVRAAYEVLAAGSGLSGRDMQVRSYLTGLYRYPLP